MAHWFTPAIQKTGLIEKKLLLSAAGICLGRLGHAMECHLEPHRPERGDLVRYARLDQARCARMIVDALLLRDDQDQNARQSG